MRLVTDTSPEDASSSDAKEVVSPPFEPSYELNKLPHISIPDLSDDTQSLSAEALASVPTLTDQVGGDLPAEPLPIEAPMAELAAPQDLPVAADTYAEQVKARLGRLTGDIQSLHSRLDRLEERNKAQS